jgi:hypothetical protein
MDEPGAGETPLENYNYDPEITGGHYYVALTAMIRDPNLTLAEKVLYHILLSYANTLTRVFPSQATLREAMGRCDPKTLRKALKGLEDKGLLVIKEHDRFENHEYFLKKFAAMTALPAEEAAKPAKKVPHRRENFPTSRGENFPTSRGENFPTRMNHVKNESINRINDDSAQNAPLPLARPSNLSAKEIREYYRDLMARIDKGEKIPGPHGRPLNMVGVLHDLAVELYGNSELMEHKMIVKLGKQVGNFWQFFDFLYAHNADKFDGDPMKHLLGCLKTKKAAPPSRYETKPLATFAGGAPNRADYPDNASYLKAHSQWSGVKYSAQTSMDDNLKGKLPYDQPS